MAELADVQDLGSCAARRVGSTPTTRTTKNKYKEEASSLYLFLYFAQNIKVVEYETFEKAASAFDKRNILGHNRI